MKHKVAIFCEPDYMLKHVGVRRYLKSLADLLSKSAQVDFVTFRDSPGGVRHWYQIVATRPAISVNLAASDEVLSGTGKEVWKTARRNMPSEYACRPGDFSYLQIGTDLERCQYDLGIISNPWMVKFEKRLPVNRLGGIVFDLCPNQLSMRDCDPAMHRFATEHARGFRYYVDECDFVIAISQAAASDFNRHFGNGNAAIGLPPLIAQSKEPPDHSIPSSDRAVVLASPFDLRKGLREMPGILNGCKGRIDVVRIYGGIRCIPDDAKEFFYNLEVPVEWWPSASASTVKGIFQQSKMLLYPSHQEGLGLPILEAQLMGTPAVVRDKQPMNQLLGPASTTANSIDRFTQQVASAIHNEIDREAIREWAEREFDNQHVARSLASASNIGWLSPAA